jgi:hypothetical protein
MGYGSWKVIRAMLDACFGGAGDAAESGMP